VTKRWCRQPERINFVKTRFLKAGERYAADRRPLTNETRVYHSCVIITVNLAPVFVALKTICQTRASKTPRLFGLRDFLRLITIRQFRRTATILACMIAVRFYNRKHTYVLSLVQTHRIGG